MLEHLSTKITKISEYYLIDCFKSDNGIIEVVNPLLLIRQNFDCMSHYNHHLTITGL